MKHTRGALAVAFILVLLHRDSVITQAASLSTHR